jgi:hypothetical protein
VVGWDCRAPGDDLGVWRTKDQRTPDRRRHAVVACMHLIYTGTMLDGLGSSLTVMCKSTQRNARG